ncbi:glutathione gamma-glutamylcysteinyltransferase 1-like isoform X1 [Salvia splendens]|uniref:glutathione gamma-glutamylcysteinyltransferase 1-like isoform X1 n=1 Tax=Salvia splendens TaxID=180675 RepID=UPI001102D79E|nr:glutathione gamma-glutamylcysteinyltransferase 1-like isoform X1 [Salvia splendens]
MAMAMASLYRRILPSPPAIDFASSEGKKLFTEAIHSGTMEGFFKLISYFQTQSEPAYCGLASLSMVLNALAIDPRRKWKGPWRWFDENMLDCCEPLEKVKNTGITFGKVVCLAHCAGAKVEAFRTTQSTIDDFRKYVMACASSEDCHVISSYHRGVFKQTGTGHFSPIGGYHAERDMALILDVARFKYPPHWVPLRLLWEAMDTVDESNGLHRGFLLVTRHQRSPALLYTLSCKHESWITTAKYLMDDVPVLLSSDNVQNVKNVLASVFMSLPADFAEFIKWVAEIRREEDNSQSLSEEEKGRLRIKEEVLKRMQETDLYKHVTDILSSETLGCRFKQTLGIDDSLPNIAASVCSQGAGILMGKSGSSDMFCCRETCVRSYRATNGDRPVTVVSGTVVNSNGEDGVDMLVPLSQTDSGCSNFGSCDYSGMHPASNDVLTALLLALPPETWSGIKDEKTFEEVSDLVSTEQLHPLLQEEILHLRGQLLMLKRCKDNKVEDDLGSIGVTVGTSHNSNSLHDVAISSQRSNFYPKQTSCQKNSRTLTRCSIKIASSPWQGVLRPRIRRPGNGFSPFGLVYINLHQWLPSQRLLHFAAGKACF